MTSIKDLLKRHAGHLRWWLAGLDAKLARERAIETGVPVITAAQEADDFLERHVDAIENALLKKHIEELYVKMDMQKALMPLFPHSGEWIREIGPDGIVKLSYPPRP